MNAALSRDTLPDFLHIAAMPLVRGDVLLLELLQPLLGLVKPFLVRTPLLLKLLKYLEHDSGDVGGKPTLIPR